MELKKHPEVDLQKKRPMYFQIGLAATLALILLAFEWKSYEISESSLGDLDVEEVEQEIIPISEQRKQPPPPPPPPPVVELEIVDNDADVEEAEVQSSEANEETVVEYQPPAPEEETNEADVFTIVEDMPLFPGGDAALLRYIATNIKYPQIARENGIQGTVFVAFVVNEKGVVTDPKILRGIGGGCDEEAIRVIKTLPKYTPGMQRGKPVKVQFQIPIKFNLK